MDCGKYILGIYRGHYCMQIMGGITGHVWEALPHTDRKNHYWAHTSGITKARRLYPTGITGIMTGHVLEFSPYMDCRRNYLACTGSITVCSS